MAKGSWLQPIFPEGEAPAERVILAYKAASLAAMALGSFWACAFAWLDWWPLAIAEFGFFVLGLGGWVMIRKGNLFGAIMICQFGFFLFAVYFCAMFDVPTETAPRVSHLFLPVLAMLGYINFLRDRSRLHLLVIAASLAAFIAFSSASLALPFAMPIPQELRSTGTWNNASLATLLMCGSI